MFSKEQDGDKYCEVKAKIQGKRGGGGIKAVCPIMGDRLGWWEG